MRKIQQSKILELISTMREAQSAGLYAEASEGALAVGAFLETIAGGGTQTAALLAEYRRLLVRAGNGEINGKALRRHLIKIENSVRSELAPSGTEIVFISYCAAMSDSILSIYQAAKADPGCNAVWLPVPYFERNPDGSFGEMHFEGADCYGDAVACADWRTYDMEARRPDAVVSYAPYDEGNLVTSVHPDFYFRRLRERTDLLVYVPYFVTMGEVREHFCTLAGCVYAHKVMVASEEERRTYLRVFQKAFGSRHGKPADKFVALGSPKFDAVLHARREDCKLPDSWRERIAGKKVIFYNTTLGAMLAGNEQYLEKLRSVLETFRQRGDVVLWWRPHPLSEQTYRSMRPALAEEWRGIVAEYRGGEWGIYDDTPDLHRAIAWSDAYYGDRSSLAALYGATKKPLLISARTRRHRENFHIQNWYTADVDEDDLNNWLDGKEKWKYLKDFSDVFDGRLIDGNVGRRIYEYVLKEIKRFR
ncbi:MAG: CDP-glycerol glycerophosphotransferase family protein [Clostridium sp.]|nr:CDP-glycerol glycerophosphotransferase family protein [Clostridium sp.]